MRFSRILYFLLFLTLSFGVSAKKKDVGLQKVYAFGFASSFTDSLAYLTDVQELDSAYILSNGFIADRSLYSLQLYGYVSETKGLENATTAFFFAPKAKTLVKKYEKLKRMYMQSENLKLVVLTRDEFCFKPEEYVETLVTQLVEDEPKAGEAKASDNGKKGKSKQKKEKKK